MNQPQDPISPTDSPAAPAPAAVTPAACDLYLPLLVDRVGRRDRPHDRHHGSQPSQSAGPTTTSAAMVALGVPPHDTANATASEDLRLAANLDRHLEGCAGCRAELAALTADWELLGRLPASEPGPEVAERFAALLAETRAEEARAASGRDPGGAAHPFAHRAPATTPGWSFPRLAAAGLIVAVGAFAVGRASVRQAVAPELAELRTEVRSLTGLVSLSLLDQGSASARLQGVSYGRRLGDSDPLVQEALLRTATTDPSASVRAAAIEALAGSTTYPPSQLDHQPTEQPDVRQTLLAQLPDDPSPLVQIAIIDLLLGPAPLPGRPAELGVDRGRRPGELDVATATRLLELASEGAIAGSGLDPHGTARSGDLRSGRSDTAGAEAAAHGGLDPTVRDYLRRRLATSS